MPIRDKFIKIIIKVLLFIYALFITS